MRNNKFTLIELLVVLAIIGILVSILMPSLVKAREQARMAICLSNNKQLSLAFHTYAAQNNNRTPFTYGEITFDDLLGMGQYDGRNLTYAVASQAGIVDEEYASKIYYCPSASYNKFNAVDKYKHLAEYVTPADGTYEGKFAGQYTRSYSINGGLNQNNSAYKTIKSSKSGIMRDDGSAHLTSLESPSDTILLKENIHQNHTLGRNKKGRRSSGNTTTWTHFVNGLNQIRLHGRHGRLYYGIASLSDGSAKNINFHSTYISDDDNMWDRD